MNSNKGKWTRSTTGAGMSTLVNFEEEDRRIGALSEEERHLTGHMYKYSNGKV